MKTKTARNAKPMRKRTSLGPFPLISQEMQDVIKRMDAQWNRVEKWPKARQRAYLVEIGALTPDGKLRRYAMNHVPLGPRE
jgi:hypothetical protein